MKTWRTVRVFISSTFRDMQAERDHLVRFVFPRLRAELLNERIHFLDVDLRWGVTGDRDAISVCQEIIDGCRPRFICILGGRYGSTPEGSRYSITAEEVYYSLGQVTAEEYRYFYFRDPETTAAITEKRPGEFREPSGSENERKLDELKQAVRDAGYDPFVYRAEWDDQQGRLIDLDVFGERVFTDIMDSIVDEFGHEPPPKGDELALERAAMDAVVADYTKGHFLGSRKSLYLKIVEFAHSDGPLPVLVLTGPSGSGKSALLARFCHEVVSHDPNLRVLHHFIGASPASSDLRRMLLRLCYELGEPTDRLASAPKEISGLIQRFEELLRHAALSDRLVLVIDGLDQIDSTDFAHDMNWLPVEMPAEVRLIVSSLPHPALDALRSRGPSFLREEKLTPLEVNDSQAIIEEFLSLYQKEMSPEQLRLLLEKPRSDVPLYLSMALEEIRTIGTFEKLADCIRELPGDAHRLFLWVLNRLSEDPGFLDEDGRLIGRELVTDLVSALSASRYGLSEGELTFIVTGEGKDARGNVGALLRFLRPYIVHRGSFIDFFHGELRKAVKQGYLADENSSMKAHGKLADCFESRLNLTDNRDRHGLAELPYHLRCAARWERLNDLARSADFLGAQVRYLTDDTNAPLRTMETALEGALERDEAAEMAEFSLRHARWLCAASARTPLHVLRADGLEKAWQLSALRSAEDAVLLFLLLVWEVKDSGRSQEALSCLRRIQDATLPRLDEWMELLAAHLLSEAQKVDPECVYALQNRLLEDAGRLELVGQLSRRGHFEAALKTAQAISNDKQRDKALIIVSRHQAEAERFDEALRVASGIFLERERAQAMSEIGVFQVKASQDAQATFKAALKNAQEISDPEYQADCLTKMADAAARAGEREMFRSILDSAIQAVRETDDWERVGVLDELMTTLLRLQEFEAAEQAAAGVPEDKLLPENRIQYFIAISSAATEAGDQERARRIIDSAFELAQKFEEDYHRAWALSLLGKEASELGNQDSALSAFAEAQELAVELFRSGLRRESFEVLEVLAEARAKTGEIEDAITTAMLMGRCRAQLDVFSRITCAAADRGEFQKALAVARKIQDFPEDFIEALCYIAMAQAKQGGELLESALANFSHAVRKAQETSVPGFFRVLIAVAQAESNEVWEACRTIEQIEDTPDTDAAWSAVAMAYARKRQFQNALAATRKIDDKDKRDVALRYVAIQQVENYYLASSLETADRIENGNIRLEALGRIVEAQIAAEELDDAAATAEKMFASNTRFEALRKVAAAHERAGDMSSARETLARTLEAEDLHNWEKMVSRSIERIEKASEIDLDRHADDARSDGKDDDPKALAEQALKKADAGSKKSAKKTLARALEIARGIDDERKRADALTAVANAQARIGCQDASRDTFASAVEIARDFKHKPLELSVHTRAVRGDALRKIAASQAVGGDFEEALATAEIIEDSRRRDLAFGDVAKTQAKAGYFERATQTARRISGLHSTFAATLAEIAAALANSGERERSRNLFSQSLRAAEKLSDDWLQTREEALLMIGRAQARAGEFEAAIRTAFAIEHHDWRREVLVATALAQAHRGEHYAAIHAAQLIEHEYDRSDTLAAIAKIQAHAGWGEEAVKTAGAIHGERESCLSRIVMALAEVGDCDNLKRLIVTAAYYPWSTFSVCISLAELYPEQSSAIVRVMGESRRYQYPRGSGTLF